MYAWCTPEWVLQRHAADQVANLALDRWTAGLASRLPTPIESPTLPMPTEDSLGLYDYQDISPTMSEARKPNPEDSIQTTQTRTTSSA